MRDLGTREQYITKQGHLRVKGVEGTAQWVARRMRELHEVPLEVMRKILEQGDLNAPTGKGFGRGIENNIMASSHRPRKASTKPTAAAARGSTPAPAAALPDAGRLLRDSPAPMSAEEEAEATSGTSLAKVAASAAWEQEVSKFKAGPSKAGGQDQYPAERNGSVASFDSLATSFDSRASFSSFDERFGKSPSSSGTSFTGNGSYFPPQSDMAKMAQSPVQSKASTPGSNASSSSSSARRPYPGVWRRLKRWSREAAKVLQLFNDFAQSAEGKLACEIALQGAPAGIDIKAPQTITSDVLKNTSGNLCSTLLCIIAIDFPRLMHEFDVYKRFIRDWERKEGQSRRVFSHNDSQYGNLLRVIETETAAMGGIGMPRNQAEVVRDREREGASSGQSRGGAGAGADGAAAAATAASKRRSTTPNSRRRKTQPHQQIVVIDFEYASPNPRGYDIANHFHEWRADYHHPTLSWSLTHHGAYPTESERRKWLRAYVEQGRLLRMRGAAKGPPAALETPTEFSLGPPAFPVGSGSSAAAAKSKGDARQRRSSTADMAGLEPSLTPFLCGQTSPLSPPLGMSSSPASSPMVNPQQQQQQQGAASASANPLARLNGSIEREVDRLEREVNMWSPAAHAVWSLWGMVFCREEVEMVVEKSKRIMRQVHRGGDKRLEQLSKDDPQLVELAGQKAVEEGAEEAFDNLRYALNRVELFRYEMKAMGLLPTTPS